MNNSYLNLPIDKELRERFKKRCKRQGITIQKAVPMLMQKVVDGEMGFSPVKRDVFVTNRKR